MSDWGTISFPLIIYLHLKFCTWGKGCKCAFSKQSEGDIRSQGARDTGGLELVDVDDGNQTGVLCKSQKTSELLTHLSTSDLLFIKYSARFSNPFYPELLEDLRGA